MNSICHEIGSWGGARAPPLLFYKSTTLLTCATRPYTLLCTFSGKTDAKIEARRAGARTLAAVKGV